MVTPMARLAERESSSTSGGAVVLLHHGSQTLPIIVPPSTLWECLGSNSEHYAVISEGKLVG